MIAQASLGSLVEPAATWDPSRSAETQKFKYIDLSAIDQDAKEIVGVRDVDPVDAPSRARQLVAEGDVLVSTVRPNLNGVARIRADLHGATASTGFCVLRPRNGRLDSAYLFQWVKAPAFVDQMTRLATGASYPAVSDRIVLESAIPLPPLPQQRRIADILDHADILRAKRRAALALLDTLTQSIFIDMFGDPATNPRGWPMKTLAGVAKVVTGNTPPRAEPLYYGKAIEWIKSDNINPPDVLVTPAVEGLSLEGRLIARVAPPGATLVTCIAGSPNSIGNAAMTDRDVAFNQQINALIPLGMNPRFLYGLVTAGKSVIQGASTSSMKGMVTKSRLEAIQVLVPPISEQQRFAIRAAAADKLRAIHCNSLTQMDALFASLQHRAFRGEL